MNTRLYPHHTDPQKTYDFSKPIAEMNQHPNDPNIWGLKNMSDEKWIITTKDGTVKEVESGKNVPLAEGTMINFGRVQGEIRSERSK